MNHIVKKAGTLTFFVGLMLVFVLWQGGFFEKKKRTHRIDGVQEPIYFQQEGVQQEQEQEQEQENEQEQAGEIDYEYLDSVASHQHRMYSSKTLIIPRDQ